MIPPFYVNSYALRGIFSAEKLNVAVNCGAVYPAVLLYQRLLCCQLETKNKKQKNQINCMIQNVMQSVCCHKSFATIAFAAPVRISSTSENILLFGPNTRS